MNAATISALPVDRNASTIPAPPLDLPKQCTCCGAVLTGAEWAAMQYVGIQDAGGGEHLELRNCACNSTLARSL